MLLNGFIYLYDISVIMMIFLYTILYFASSLLVSKYDNMEKLAPYECGFSPFLDSRVPFDIHFYLYAILFLILDLEFIFLYPFATELFHIGVFGYFVMIFFSVVLGIGMLYEFAAGGMDIGPTVERPDNSF